MTQGTTALLHCDRGRTGQGGTIEMLISGSSVTICFTGNDTHGTQEKITDILLECYRERVKKWMN